jgi:hypothetical protein
VSVNAQIKTQNIDSFINVQNTKIEQLNNLLNYQDSIIKAQNQSIQLLRENVRNVKISDLEPTVQVIAIIVAIMTFIITLLTIYLSWFNYSRSQDIINTINESKKTVEDHKIVFYDLDQKYNDSFNTNTREFKNSISELKKNFDQEFISSIDRIKENSDIVENNKKIVTELNKEITSQKSFLKESIELIFDLLLVSANNLQDKKFYSQIFVKRAVSLLYSFKEEERFAGICTLSSIGTLAEVKHLENVLINKDETDNNILLASNAIAEIKLR